MKPDITDEYMRHMLLQTKAYTLVKIDCGIAQYGGGRPHPSGAWPQQFSLARGRSSGHCLSGDRWRRDQRGGDFNGSLEEVKRIMDHDPGVQAGMFTYEIHPCRSFPGDRLPD